MQTYRSLLFTLVVGAAISLLPTLASAAGFSVAQVEDPGQSNLTVGIWYPSETVPPDTPNTKFGHALAVDAQPVGKELPLILISHGFGGWYGGHADTALALAEAGYVVAAPSHAGNTYSDMSAPIERWALDRPRQISATLSYMQNSWAGKQRLDTERVGLYGFSAGGFTALSLIGGVPDLERAVEHCEVTPTEFVCREGMVARMMDQGMQHLPTSAWGSDPRIKAAAIAAPGFAFAYAAQDLASVHVPVQLWSALNDHSVPHESNAAPLAKALPTPVETHWVANANHFAFMIIPCRPAFKESEPEEYQMVCGDAPGFDRRVFHDTMNEELVRYFSERLH